MVQSVALQVMSFAATRAIAVILAEVTPVMGQVAVAAARYVARRAVPLLIIILFAVPVVRLQRTDPPAALLMKPPIVPAAAIAGIIRILVTGLIL